MQVYLTDEGQGNRQKNGFLLDISSNYVEYNKY